MTCPGTDNGALVDGYIVAVGRGSQLRVRLEDGREIRAIPELKALEAAECPEALIFNRPCPGAHVQASKAAPYRVDRAS